MKKHWRVMLVLVAVICIGIALSYPVKYKLEEKRTEDTMERLVEMRDAGLAKRGAAEEKDEEPDGKTGKEGAGETEPQAESERPEGTAPSDSEGSAAQEEEAEEEPVEVPEEEPKEAQGGESEAAAQGEAVEGEAVEASGAQIAVATRPEAAAQSEAEEAAEAQSEAAQGEVAEAVEAQPEAAVQSEEAAQSETQEAAEAQPEAASQGESAAPEQSVEARPQERPAEASAILPAMKPEASAAAEGTATEGPTATPEPTATPDPTRTPTPAPTTDRFERTGAEPYERKAKRTLDADKILPQFQEIYAENSDFVGWITIPDTAVDYPVVQTEDSDYYLHHDFFGGKNANGQIILDTKCDPYTPSYNLVISGHSMRSGKMFGRLVNYMNESYWENHKLVYFDTLMDERTYVVFAAFFSADYDVDETGFRYNADIQYSVDARQWLREVKDNELYDTGIDVEFGDEFLTLTTCNKAKRSDGRFVVVCRRLREGESIE